MVIAPLQDHRQSLLPGEFAAVASSGDKRVIDYSTGRYCVRRAQDILQLPREQVLREQRAPLWPSGCVGSISHCDIAASAILSAAHASIGIDIERTDRVKAKLFPSLFTDKEVAALTDLPEPAAAIMFSAKEAGYKAIYPIGKRFIGFHEAEVFLDWHAQTFSIRYIGAHVPNKQVDTGRGYWRIFAGYVMTVFVLD